MTTTKGILRSRLGHSADVRNPLFSITLDDGQQFYTTKFERWPGTEWIGKNVIVSHFPSDKDMKFYWKVELDARKEN